VVAVVAIAGGIELIATSSGFLLRRPFELHLASPFVSFRATGLILAVLVGGSQAIAAVLFLRRHDKARVVAWTASLIAMAWGMLQVLVLDEVTWFQVALMAVGAVEVLLAAASTPR